MRKFLLTWLRLQVPTVGLVLIIATIAVGCDAADHGRWWEVVLAVVLVPALMAATWSIMNGLPDD